MTGTQAGRADLNRDRVVYLDVALLCCSRRGDASWRWWDQRRRHGGAGLHVRFAILFSAVTVTPAVGGRSPSSSTSASGCLASGQHRAECLDHRGAGLFARAPQHHSRRRAGDRRPAEQNAPALAGDPNALHRLSFAAGQLAARGGGHGRVGAGDGAFGAVAVAGVRPGRLGGRGGAHGEIIVLTGENDRVRAVIRWRFVDAIPDRPFVDSAPEHVQRVERAVTSTIDAKGKPRHQAASSPCSSWSPSCWCSPRLDRPTLASQMAEPIVELIDFRQRARRAIRRPVEVQGGDEVARLGRANRMTSWKPSAAA